MKLFKLSVFVCVFSTCSFGHAASVNFELKVNYKTAMSHIDKKHLEVVKKLADFGKKHPRSRFIVNGHADKVGSYKVNVGLSKGRAEIFKKTLMKYGIEEDRIEKKWYSYDKPIASNKTSEGRRKNRRTNITVFSLTKEEAGQLSQTADADESFSDVETKSVDFDQQLDSDLSEEDVLQEESIEKKEPEAKVKTAHRYSFSWSVLDNSIDVFRPGFEAKWITDFIHAFSLAYQRSVGSDFWLGAQVGYQLQNYKSENSPFYSWDNETPDLFKLDLMLDYEPSPRWGIGFDLSYGEENFIITNLLDISLVKAKILKGGLRGAYKFYQSENSSSRLHLGMSVPFSSSGDLEVEGDLAFLVGLDHSFNHIFKNHELNIGVEYGIKKFQNIQNQQDETFIGLEFKIRNKKWL